MAEREVKLTVTADAEQAKKAAKETNASIQGLTQSEQDLADAAKKAAQAAENQARANDDLSDAAKKAAQEAAEANEKIRESADRAADGFGKVGESAGKLGGILEMFGIEGAQNIADLADAGELASQATGALGISLTAAAAAATAVAAAGTIAYGVWTLYAAEAEHARQVQDRLNAVLDVAKTSSEDLTVLSEQLAVATGDLSSEEAAYRASLRESEKVHEANIDSIAERVGLTRQQVEASYDAAQASKEAYTSLSEQQKTAVTMLGVENTAYEKKTGLLLKIRDAETENRESAEKKTLTDKELAEVQRILAERLARTTAALRESAAAMDESSAVTAQYQATFAQIKKVTDDYNSSVLTGSAAIEDARKREQAALLAIYQQTMANAQSDQERMDANAAFADARASIDAKYATQQMTLADEQAAKFEENHALALQYAQEESASAGSALTEKAAAAKSFFDENIAVYADAVGQIADIASEFSQKALEESLARLDKLSERRKRLTEQQKENAKAAQEATDAQTRSELEAANAILEDKKARLKEQSKEERQQAMKAFRINQAIQIAGAISSSALAVINAFATVPYPAAIAAGVAASAAGTAAVATVLAQKPQFHQGGVIQANVLSGEGVANRDLVRAVGEQNFNAMNRNPEAAAAALTGGGGTSLIIGRREAAELARTMIVGRTIVSREIGKRQLPNRVAPGTSNKSVLS